MIPEIEMRDIPNTATPDVGTCPALHSRPIAGVRHLDVSVEFSSEMGFAWADYKRG